MTGYIKFKNHRNSELSSDIVLFNKPEYVYIPLILGKDENITLVVKKGDRVKKGTIVGKSKGNLRTSILSSVSGEVIGFEEKYYNNGKKVKCVTIKNDFKEELEIRQNVQKNITNYTKEEFVSKLEMAGIIGLGGAGYPTYKKYDTNKKITTLIVNATECEPGVMSDYAIMKEYPEEILESIDAIMDINGIKEAFIALKKTDTEIINIFKSYIGTYLKIKLFIVKDVYPSGWERNLVKQIKKTTYKSFPTEKGIVVNNISTIFAVYETLKYGKPLVDRVITFSGEGLVNPCNIKVKNGTNVAEVINSIGGYKEDDVRIIAGGPLMGITLPTDDFVITPTLTSVTVMKTEKRMLPSECMRCGKCVTACPAKLSPIIIKEHLSDIKRLKALKAGNCIECGLCSFVCPSKINVREFVKKAKQIIREEK